MKNIITSIIVITLLISCSNLNEKKKYQENSISELSLIQLNNSITSNKTISRRLQKLLFAHNQLCMYEVHTTKNIEKYSLHYNLALLIKANDKELINNWNTNSTVTFSNVLNNKNSEYSFIAKEFIKRCAYNFLEYSNYESSLEKDFSDSSIEDILSIKNKKTENIAEMTLLMVNLLNNESSLFESLTIIHNYHSFLLSILNNRLTKYEFNSSSLQPIFKFKESEYSSDSVQLTVNVGFIDTTMTNKILWGLKPEMNNLIPQKASVSNNSIIIPKTYDTIYGVISYSYNDILKWVNWKKNKSR